MKNSSVTRSWSLHRLWLIALFLMPLTHAQNSIDALGSADYPGIARFPGALIAEYNVQQNANYRLALGRLQRVNGRVTAGREERLQGALTRITYQIPSGVSSTEVFSYFLQIIENGNDELFRCQGRACGSSNFWANDILGNRVLYGPEQEQFYAAMASSNAAGENTRYYVLYVITRGSRSVYAHLDVLDVAMDSMSASPDNPDEFVARLQEDGSVIVRGISFDEEDTLVADDGLDLVVRALQLANELQVFVVAHLRGTSEVDALVARSQQRAERIAERLQQAGVSGARLRAEGVGPLAPTCSQAPCSDRIEIVLSE